MSGIKNIQQEFVFNLEGEKSQQRLIINDPHKVKITNKEQAEAFLRKKLAENRRMFDKRGEFIISRNDRIMSLEETDITVSDRRQFMQLVLYAPFGNKPLAKDGKPLTVTDIQHIWGVARQNASAKLNKFVSLNLLKKEKCGRNYHFILNDEYFIKGKGLDSGSMFVKLFQNKLAEVIQNIKEIEDRKNKNPKVKKKVSLIDVIGLLHAMIPYFHYQTYYLVSNPDEDIRLNSEEITAAFANNKTSPKQLKHLSKAKIGRILGHKNADRRTIDTYMDYLQQAGAVLVMKSKNKTRYLIHPDLMFRMDTEGEDDYTKIIRAQFEQHN